MKLYVIDNNDPYQGHIRAVCTTLESARDLRAKLWLGEVERNGERWPDGRQRTDSSRIVEVDSDLPLVMFDHAAAQSNVRVVT
jgi:hypothetical protein